MTGLGPAFVDELRRIAGPEQVVTQEHQLRTYESDGLLQYAVTPGAVVLPSWVVTAVAEVPGGAAPSYAHGYSVRDNAAYAAWDGISRDRETFRQWMQDHVIGVPTTA